MHVNVLILLITGTFAVSNAVQPGIVGRINKEGFRFLETVGKDRVEKSLEGWKSFNNIPYINDLSIASVDLGDFFLNPSPPDQLSGGIKGASLEVHGTTSSGYKLFVKSTEIQVVLNISLKVTDNGILSFTSRNCVASIGVLTTRVEPWYMRFLVGMILPQNKVKDLLQDKICQILSEFLSTKVEKYEASAQFIIPLLYNTSSDLRLTNPPTVSASDLTLYASGRCFLDTHQSFPNYIFTDINPTIPLRQSTDMVQVCVKDDVINSFLQALFQNQLLRFNLTVDDIMTFFLVTDLPDQLINAMTPFNMTSDRTFLICVSMVTPPTTQFTVDFVIVEGRIEALGMYNPPNEGAREMGVITSNIQLIGRFHSDDDVIFASFDNISVSNTTSQGFPPQFVTYLMSGLVSSELLSALNELTTNGYQLPDIVEGIVSNIQVSTDQNFLELGLNLRTPLDIHH